MTSVIRQEWKRRSSNTYTVAIVLAAVNLLALALFFFSDGQTSHLPFLPEWFLNELLIPIVLIMDTLGFYVGIMFDNAASMKDMLFKDNGYLMKLLPVNSWKLIGGKYITGLLELLFFGVQCGIYLFMFMIMATDHFEFGGLNKVETLQGFELLFMGCFVLIGLWLFVNTLINLSRTVTSVITKRWKVPKSVIYIVIILVTWLTLKWTGELIGLIFDNMFKNVVVDFSSLTGEVVKVMLAGGWTITGVMVIFAGIYYAITCWLYEKHVEV